ncbi:FO synthase subunit 1 /FO synthase subunit 2 [Aromatoleum tolulyticum]|uniref:FO synthase n=1 Tax=Aromatoleum tolulyticum TaxID=34027 RepID=A0A1N7C7L6_9RHOO|nr:5-amino-6-(D-ribitylamino)uracil--L-tyrosine 4-hydroxyphenyl transferase CofH [Aromatoleum tolulyticum]SIR59585.1 FO synthase subunit 1 /FO synthase subunit 2 [Aromatoleum tolulyticum]
MSRTEMPFLAQRRLPTRAEALALATQTDTGRLMAEARKVRDRGFRNLVTWSRKVFIPLTQLCRDVCHYCAFAGTPKSVGQAYLPVESVLATVREAAALGCKEALFTLGEKPELRWQEARDALARLGFASTIDYLAHVAGRVLEETGVLPHINAGNLTQADIEALRPVSASMGLMLESSAAALGERGKPHFGSPDKAPDRRLETIRLAGEARVPFTSGLLIGIGESRADRIESLLALRDLHTQYGHLQEVIIQNFRAKPGTKMADAPEPDLDDMLWTLAVARLVLGPDMSIQAPPNLSPGELPQLVAAGINDWGGVSPLTPDFVNPEAPWPHVEQLRRQTAAAGKYLHERLTVYPSYVVDGATWLAPTVHKVVLRMVDAEGYPRLDDWLPGKGGALPAEAAAAPQARVAEGDVAPEVMDIVARASAGAALDEAEIVRLFQARGPEFAYVCQAADQLRRHRCGEAVSYVVNRNISYTNICYFNCQFCAFSKGKHSDELAGTPYDLEHDEVARRVREAWERGGTEVCLQGGIHPAYTGQKYLDLLATIRAVAPDIHVHAFSPLEVSQGARTLGVPVETFLRRLRDAGLNTLPGTAAEILDDEVRAVICPDKLRTDEWLEVVGSAHRVGLRTTSTIMFGHIDRIVHWARHLVRLRELQRQTGGFTEFVPLPFVGEQAPMYLKGRARKGPTFREAVLMHSVARLVLNGLIDNIQTSWVKMGDAGALVALAAGANDLGGTLMNEMITRAAGAQHGQEKPPAEMERLIRSAGREPRQRSTQYGGVPEERRLASFAAAPLAQIVNSPPRKVVRPVLVRDAERADAGA